MVRPTSSVLVLILATSFFPATVSAQTSDTSGWAASATVLALPGFALYRGRVNLQHAGITDGPRYTEETSLAMGVQIGGSWTTDQMGPMALSVLVAGGESTGTYSGVSSQESHTRDILTLGLDVGWEPRLGYGNWGSLQVPFGPSVMWHRLELSAGHRDAYGDPDGFTAPDVDWSDRTWLSWGGFGGLALTLNLTPSLGFVADASARFTFPNTGSWAGQEEEDINVSTGNVVLLNYESPVIFFWTGRAGFTWRP